MGSNHLTSSMLNCLTFDQFINFKLSKFYFWLNNCISPCFALQKVYFCNFSTINSEHDELFQAKYSLNNVEDSEMDALIAMMYFAQVRELSSFDVVAGEWLSLLVTFFSLFCSHHLQYLDFSIFL